MILGPLYHWSPNDRRESIQANGLVPGSRSVIASTELPHICLGFDPAAAWSISGAMPWANEERWDLWLVRLADEDALSIRAEYGPQLQEVMVSTVIPPERLWLVGERRHSLS